MSGWVSDGNEGSDASAKAIRWEDEANVSI